MYRYQGNTGRYVWVPDPPSQVPAPSRGRLPEPSPARERRQNRGGRQNESRQMPPREDRERTGTGRPSLLDLGGGLSDMLSKAFPDGFEMEDALLLLVLFLMYKETGDKDLLIIMGAMFLL